MENSKALKLSDLPTIEELQQRFRQRERTLSFQLGSEEAKKEIKSKNTFAYQFIMNNFHQIEKKDKILFIITLMQKIYACKKCHSVTRTNCVFPNAELLLA